MIIPSAIYVLAIGADPHADAQYAAGYGRDLTRLEQTADAMSADAVLMLGDLGGDRYVDIDGDGDTDCSVPTEQTATCPWPSPWLAQLWRDARSLDTRPWWAIGGNHDGHAAVPIDGYRRPNQWWHDTVKPLSEPGVVRTDGDADDHFEVEIALDGGTWDLLLVGDAGWRQDRAIGGRCDERDLPWLGTGYTHCSTLGWSEGVINPDQLVWLEQRIADAEAAGHYVLIGTHQPVPHTVVLTDGPGQSYEVVCPPSTQFPKGITVQGVPMTNWPRDASILPDRTDLDSPGPRDTAHDWQGTLLRWQAGSEPDDQWGLTLVRAHPGVVRLWVSGHNHLPVPDLTYAGRGVRYDDPASGTTFLSHGAVGRAWCAIGGACTAMQAARLELHADGSWAWQRWSIQGSPNPLPQGCTTSAILPAVRPNPWGGLPVETGP